MTDLELIIIGVLLGAIPTSDLGRLAVAGLAKRVGLEPADIRKYNAATSDDAADSASE